MLNQCVNGTGLFRWYSKNRPVMPALTPKRDLNWTKTTKTNLVQRKKITEPQEQQLVELFLVLPLAGR